MTCLGSHACSKVGVEIQTGNWVYSETKESASTLVHIFKQLLVSWFETCIDSDPTSRTNPILNIKEFPNAIKACWD